MPGEVEAAEQALDIEAMVQAAVDGIERVQGQPVRPVPSHPDAPAGGLSPRQAARPLCFPSSIHRDLPGITLKVVFCVA